MNTISGFESGYVFLGPQTVAARMLQELDRPDGSMIQVSDNQTCLDFGSLALVERFSEVELYDYVSDGVVFEETPAETTTPVMAAGEQSERNPALFFGRGARLPKFRLDLQKDGKDFDMSIRISGHNPNETAREGAKATQEAGTALYETLDEIAREELEAFRGREGSSDKAAVAAISYTCMEKIIYCSQRNGMVTDGKLEAVIRREQPGLVGDEVFKRVLRHFNADPEAFREKFAQYDGAAFTQILRAHPARAAFLIGHGLEAEAPEAGDVQ